MINPSPNTLQEKLSKHKIYHPAECDECKAHLEDKREDGGPLVLVEETPTTPMRGRT